MASDPGGEADPVNILIVVRNLQIALMFVDVFAEFSQILERDDQCIIKTGGCKANAWREEPPFGRQCAIGEGEGALLKSGLGLFAQKPLFADSAKA